MEGGTTPAMARLPSMYHQSTDRCRPRSARTGQRKPQDKIMLSSGLAERSAVSPHPRMAAMLAFPLFLGLLFLSHAGLIVESAVTTSARLGSALSRPDTLSPTVEHQPASTTDSPTTHAHSHQTRMTQPAMSKAHALLHFADKRAASPLVKRSIGPSRSAWMHLLSPAVASAPNPQKSRLGHTAAVVERWRGFTPPVRRSASEDNRFEYGVTSPSHVVPNKFSTQRQAVSRVAPGFLGVHSLPADEPALLSAIQTGGIGTAALAAGVGGFVLGSAINPGYPLASPAGMPYGYSPYAMAPYPSDCAINGIYPGTCDLTVTQLVLILLLLLFVFTFIGAVVFWCCRDCTGRKSR